MVIFFFFFNFVRIEVNKMNLLVVVIDKYCGINERGRGKHVFSLKNPMKGKFLWTSFSTVD